MIIQAIFSYLEQWAPLHLQANYDNAGLQLGDPTMKVTAILTCLEFSLPVLQDAVEQGCNLVIAHHPLLFKSVSYISPNTRVGKMIYFSIKHKLTLYAAHTNLDFTPRGLAYKMAKKLSLNNISPLQPLEVTNWKITAWSSKDLKIVEKSLDLFNVVDVKKENYLYNSALSWIASINKQKAWITSVMNNPDIIYHVSPIRTMGRSDNIASMGLLGHFSSPVFVNDFFKKLKDLFQLKFIFHSDTIKSMVQKIAICPGSGGSLLTNAIKSKADTFITGDVGYHLFQSAENRILLVDIGHYESEQEVKKYFKDELSKKFDKIKIVATIRQQSAKQIYS